MKFDCFCFEMYAYILTCIEMFNLLSCLFSSIIMYNNMGVVAQW